MLCGCDADSDFEPELEKSRFLKNFLCFQFLTGFLSFKFLKVFKFYIL